MNYTLTEADRKRLLTFLEEHDHDFSVSYPGRLSLYCAVCDTPDYIGKNRDFTSPDDRQALCEALMREERWDEFHVAMRHEFCKDYITVCTREQMEAEFNTWLLVEQPERCNYLIAKFLEEER
jgi:hypothetical protein